MEYSKDYEIHESLVDAIAAKVRSFYQRQQGSRILHGSTNSTRPAHGDRVVDISPLDRILKIDPRTRTAVVEPNVTMDKLVDATLQDGLMPPVVMEFPGITVGGGFAGSAGESSSFEHGYFSDTVNWVEMILGDGRVVRASKFKNEDLFYGAAGAAGTLGITTLLELRLVPAKPYVSLTYHPTSSIEETVESIRKETENSENNYVDGIVFARNSGVVMTGVLADERPLSVRLQTFSRPWDPWFYMHVQQRVQNPPGDGRAMVDYIPIRDYLFRYDRGGFWIGRESFRYFGFVPFNGLTRWFLDDFLHARMLYRALHGAKAYLGFMIQDLVLPYSTAQDLIAYTVENLNIWPLWVCPLRGMQGPTFHPCCTSGNSALREAPQPMLNIGLWGRASQDPATFVKQNRDLEQRLRELQGRKVLYSQNYYTEGEFWHLYDGPWYEALRQKYGATTLPSIYDKVSAGASKLYADQTSSQWLRSSWPLAGIVGIFAALRSGDYVYHRQPLWKTIWASLRRKLDLQAEIVSRGRFAAKKQQGAFSIFN
ncbi:delta24-sterol reductase [Apiospora rasikravindrae]|uniref:Delta(24)-sterol reductase n=1 Tax=Apiospora rasikravindrae TaxID=990691 RepID=A0ABR1S4B2_9PEZI